MTALAAASTSTAIEACVVDASVGVKLFLDETLSDAAHALFLTLLTGDSAFIFVPDLFYIECTNVLWKHHRRFGLSRADAEIAVDQLGKLLLRSTPTALLMADAFALAVDYDITTYDAAYAALARRISAPLITADQALLRKLTGSEIDVRWLGEWLPSENGAGNL
ncbi:type II toxin-antitoxin system VapC family toxin [Caldilinea sp.]|uniref:type II toxin-antitoxin system VapC family toxin n=1 Tax=Caldilinea sp. TaxID=2293560 RepID=UPI0021DBF1D3|nr:type II toxin-antitoxin system VapC family toxin [Caldilinea sp.]GIV67433.1 MAG: hypothetical protein KatS3mg048_0295 [Caldilinea sp.]